MEVQMNPQMEMVKKNAYRVASYYFDVTKTLECGQCFRWQKTGDSYVGVVAQSVIVIGPLDDDHHMVTIYGNEMTYAEIAHYFDLETDYEHIFDQLSTIDDHMNNAAAYGKGIRILNQEPFETLLSFIISSNNNIPKIRMTVEALSEKFGKYLGHFQGKPYYTFPDLMTLASASLESLNVKAIGYRAKSIFNTCNRLVEAAYDLQEPYLMDYEEARTWLTQFYGVGGKVADCVLLFAYGNGGVSLRHMGEEDAWTTLWHNS